MSNDTPTWDEIDRQAADAQVQLLRRKHSVSGYTKTIIVSHLFDLSIGDLDEKDSDLMLRAMCFAAVTRMKAMFG